MVSTQLLEAIDKLREQNKTPIQFSNMEILRQSALRDLARLTGTPEPEVFTEAQRKLFVENCDRVAGFLASEDGADSVELLVDAFRRYTAGPRDEVEEPS